MAIWGFPNYLAQLVIDGIKTATCSCHIFYELENEPLPTTNDYSIILNSQDEPVAIIKTIEVTVTPMNEVKRRIPLSLKAKEIARIITGKTPMFVFYKGTK